MPKLKMTTTKLTLQSAKISRLRARSLAITQGVLSAVGFSWLLAGSNATTALIPLYHTELGFTPLQISLTFGCYVSVLVPILFLMSRPRLAQWAAISMVTAMFVAAVAGLAIANANTFGILGGRALSGVAMGLATGAASALVVASIGERGRGISATGNTIGGIVGTLLGQIYVNTYGLEAMSLTYEAHAAISAMLGGALSLVLYFRRQANREILELCRSKSPSSLADHVHLRTQPVLIGCLAWITVSASVVFMPSLFNSLDMTNTQKSCALLTLIACAVGQLASRPMTRFIPWFSGTFAAPAGMVMVLAGAWCSSDTLALAGFTMAGLGLGISYRLGLLACVQNASPAQQAALASRYAAVTYLAAFVAVVGTGLIGNCVGLPAAAIGLFASTAGLFLPLIRNAPRLSSFA